jgi:hypothetical protein
VRERGDERAGEEECAREVYDFSRHSI